MTDRSTPSAEFPLHAAPCPVGAQRSARRPVGLRWLMLIGSLSLLLGCGPGVVGTGTGASVPADACAASFAPAVSLCTTNASGALTTDTRPIVLTDAAEGEPARVVVTLTGDRMSLRVACQGLEFLGNWSRFEDGSLGYDGAVHSAAQPTPSRAILRVEPAPSGSGWELRVHLQDDLGASLGGPWFVRRIAGPVVDAACPS